MKITRLFCSLLRTSLDSFTTTCDITVLLTLDVEYIVNKPVCVKKISSYFFNASTNTSYYKSIEIETRFLDVV